MSTERKPRAFAVTKGTRLDLTDAERYGEVTFLFDRFDVSPMDGEEFVDAVRDKLVRAGFDPDRDFFIVAGPVLPVTLAFGAVCSQWHTVKVLMFDARESRYAARRVDLVAA